jgi:NADH-quinone oxidoreductase subunit L
MSEIFPWIILFLPLGAAAVIPLLTGENKEVSARLSIGAVVVSFWLSVMLWFNTHAMEKPVELLFSWLSVGGLDIDFGLRLDRLSTLMLLVVTGVGGAIHIFSYEYMRGDPGFSRYYASLSLFMFSMLGIVLANNFVMMFIFWELVGVSSYLLIGFWRERPAAADAAKKAFLANRIGDAGFMAGIILLWSHTGSVHFGTIEKALLANPAILGTMATLCGLLLFCGAMGKSAQWPLHVWLPDAMEGPTPVSALIHAATMVAAGIYMLCRVGFVYAATPAWPVDCSWLNSISALDVIAWIGMFTALLAAVIAVQQDDIKRILAYSTLSQLGYMVMAVGLGGPDAAMYHLTTHAFFKALLFLGAGAIIYSLHHEQNIWKMGGLKDKLPWIYRPFLLATLALCGVPPLSGFFSKDAILALAWNQNKFIFILAVLVAALTAFYMFRLIFVAFFGKSSPAHHQGHGHEGVRPVPSVMTQPMLFLLVPAIVLGFFGLEEYLKTCFGAGHAGAGLPWYGQLFAPFAHSPLAAFSGLGAAGFGFMAAKGLYQNASKDPLPSILGGWAQGMRERFYWDELYDIIVASTQDLLAYFVNAFDKWIIAGLCVRGLQGVVELTGRLLRLVQTGNVQSSVFFFAAGAALVLYLVIMK